MHLLFEKQITVCVNDKLLCRLHFQCFSIFCFGSALALNIIIGPAPKTFFAGQRADLKCVTNGPAPGLQFVRDGFEIKQLQLIENWSDYGYSIRHTVVKFQHVYQLIIKNITLCDEAIFECQVPQLQVKIKQIVDCSIL